MTRRTFLGFFVIGSIIGFFRNRIRTVIPDRERKAMFWRKTGAR